VSDTASASPLHHVDLLPSGLSGSDRSRNVNA
ncbi:MAG: hypothetical protein RIS88_2235, partial [Pseudomonadota bacterium]